MIWLLIFLWITSALSIGLPLSLLALPRERRITVFFAYGAVAGLCLQGLVVILLWGWVPLGTAVYLVLLLAVSSGALLLLRLIQQHRFSPLTWGLSRLDTVVSLALIALYGVLGQRAFTVAYTSGDNEARYWHSGLVSWLSRSSYPPTDPLEPNDPLHYRVGLHALAAGISSASNSLPPEALAATIAIIMPLAAIALVGASLRVFDRPGPGVLASILGLFGGTLFPYYSLVKAAVSSKPDLRVIDLVNGLLWHGNTLDMLHINPSIAVGFAAFSAAIWLCWETARVTQPTFTAFVVSIVALGYLGLINEVYFAALASGIVATAAIQSLALTRAGKSPWWGPFLRNAALAVLAFGIVSTRGGLLGGVSPTGGNSGSLLLTLNFDHFGSLVSPPRQPESYWTPLTSMVSQLDTDFVFLVLPVLILVTWHTKRSYQMIALLAASSVLVLWATVYPHYRPSDAYRFGQAALTIYLAFLPFALASVARVRECLATRIGHLLAVTAIVVLTVPHVFFATWLLVSPPRQTFLLPNAPDTRAAEFLRLSDTTSRVLVPDKNPQGGWEDLYLSYDFHITAGTLLALSGHAIPMGHQAGPFNPGAYRREYLVASSTFDRTALTALAVDWVYLAPSQLDADQKRYLQLAQESGTLREMRGFGNPGTPNERLLFRVASENRQ